MLTGNRCRLKQIYAGPTLFKIKLIDIPQEFVDGYDLTKYTQNWWIYFEIRKGVYGLPQSGRLSSDQIRIHLEKSGYY